MTLTANDIEPISEVSGRYGAPMGRSGDMPDPDYRGLVFLEPILDPCPNACGAYDYGGAYWGAGGMVWRAVAAEGDCVTYFRGASSLDSEERIIESAKESGGWNSARFHIFPDPLGGCDGESEPCDYCLECMGEEESEDA